jgi:hypothetical protein
LAYPDVPSNPPLLKRGVPATEQNVIDLQAAVAELFRAHSQAAQHDFEGELLVFDVDLSPLPESRQGRGV